MNQFLTADEMQILKNVNIQVTSNLDGLAVTWREKQS